MPDAIFSSLNVPWHSAASQCFVVHFGCARVCKEMEGRGGGGWKECGSCLECTNSRITFNARATSLSLVLFHFLTECIAMLFGWLKCCYCHCATHCADSRVCATLSCREAERVFINKTCIGTAINTCQQLKVRLITTEQLHFYSRFLHVPTLLNMQSISSASIHFTIAASAKNATRVADKSCNCRHRLKLSFPNLRVVGQSGNFS